MLLLWLYYIHVGFCGCVFSVSTCFLSGLCSPGQNYEQSLCRSLGGAVAEAPSGTGAWRSWAELLYGTVEADCYSSHCGSHCPGRLQRCLGHLGLQQNKMCELSLPATAISVFQVAGKHLKPSHIL